MGFCFSCCGRRDKQQPDAERQPFLRSDTDALQKAETPYEKVTDVLAALQAGKLPSQQQLDNALRTLLRSGVLEVEPGGNGSGALNESGRKVVEDAREVVEALLQIGLEKNDDNKLQDLLYQLRKLTSVPVDVKSPIGLRVNDETIDQVQTAALAIPSQNELASDTLALISSLRTLATLLLTSSAFRLILGDLLLTARELVADAAVQVRRVAETVEHVSNAVEINVRPESDANGIQPVITETQPTHPASPEPIDQEKTKSPKEVVLDRIEDIFRQAQASPQYNSAFRTLLYVLRKYAARVSLASAAISQAAQPSSGESSLQISAPVIIPDLRFSRALEDLRTLLERFAGGKSFEPLLLSLFETINEISVVPANGDSNDVQIFFRKVGLWLDIALENPSFVSSRAGRDGASSLYDEWRTRFTQNEKLSDNFQHLLGEANAFADAVKSDRTTNKFFNALDSLHTDVLTLLGRAAQHGEYAAAHWRTTLLRVVLGWMLPRLLRVIRTLPMPRLEYVSSMSNGTHIAAAIDALLLSAEEALVPDVLSVQEYAEVRVEVDERVGSAKLTSPNGRLLSLRKNTNQGGLESALHVPLLRGDSDGTGAAPSTMKGRTNVTATSRVRVHIEGLRVAAHDVGYYVSYARNSWLGYTDEGLLSVDIGRGKRRGEGLAVDVELEMDSDSNYEDNGGGGKGNERLFRVLDVRTAIPGLALRLAHSRHWILNSLLLAPLAGPIGRAVGARVLNAQVWSALESLEEIIRNVKDEADDRAAKRAKEMGEAETTVADWWDALLEMFSSGDQDVSDSDEEEPDEQEVYTETHTEATFTGVVRTTIEQPEPESDADVPMPSGNAIAVGLGAQLLPGKAEPTALGVSRETTQEAAREVAGAAREALEDMQGKIRNVQEGVQGATMKGIEKAKQVRRTAEGAEERMQRQERRERRRGGWKSRAFDLL